MPAGGDPMDMLPDLGKGCLWIIAGIGAALVFFGWLIGRAF